MGLIRQAGGTKVPAGEKLRFKILKAVEDEGVHGPQVKLTLEVLDQKFASTELHTWAKIAVDEETGERYIADGGKLFNILMAALHGNTELINSFESLEDLLGALEGRTFVSITRARGEAGKYTDITGDMIFVDSEADFEDIPF
jgi:hypothetical protein